MKQTTDCCRHGLRLGSPCPECQRARDEEEALMIPLREQVQKLSDEANARREAALLAEVAAWLERKASEDGDLAGDEVSDHADDLWVEASAFQWAAAALKDGTWRSMPHPSRGAGEAGR